MGYNYVISRKNKTGIMCSPGCGGFCGCIEWIHVKTVSDNDNSCASLFRSIPNRLLDSDSCDMDYILNSEFIRIFKQNVTNLIDREVEYLKEEKKEMIDTDFKDCEFYPSGDSVILGYGIEALKRMIDALEKFPNEPLYIRC